LPNLKEEGSSLLYPSLRSAVCRDNESGWTVSCDDKALSVCVRVDAIDLLGAIVPVVVGRDTSSLKQTNRN